MKITCSQFENLLTFYINGDITEKLKSSFEKHMEECSFCREKYEIIRTIIDDIKNAYKKFLHPEESSEQNKDFERPITDVISDNYSGIELSAYIDNELPEDRSIKIRQSIGSRPKIRKKIEKLYNLRKILRDSYKEQQNFLKTDYSKNIIKTLNENYVHKQAYMHCLFFILFVITSVIISIWIIMHIV